MDAAFNIYLFLVDAQRGLLQRADFPTGYESPIQFDTYTLNHSAFVGINEVAWTNEFEQELNRREVFVKKGSAGFSHFAFFQSTPKVRSMADDGMISIAASQELGTRYVYFFLHIFQLFVYMFLSQKVWLDQ